MDIDLADRISACNYKSKKKSSWTEIEISENISLNLSVWKNVFHPKHGFTTRYIIDSLSKKRYHWEDSFDVGCGTGVIAMALKALGFSKRVHAFDKNELAVRNAKWNISGHNKKNTRMDGIRVFHADLFFRIGDMSPQATYDGGVFNHTYLPQSEAQKVWQPLGEEGGRSLVDRFLRQASNNMVLGSPIIMPYSEIVGSKDDPRIIAEELGLKVSEIARYKDTWGVHIINEIIVTKRLKID